MWFQPRRRPSTTRLLAHSPAATIFVQKQDRSLSPRVTSRRCSAKSRVPSDAGGSKLGKSECQSPRSFCSQLQERVLFIRKREASVTLAGRETRLIRSRPERRVKPERKAGQNRGGRGESPARPLGSPEGPRGAQSRAAALPHAPGQLLPGKAGTGLLSHPGGPAGKTPARDSPGRCCPEPTQPRRPPLRGTHPFSPVGLSPRQLQQDRAAFHPQRAGQGCPNGARGVAARGPRPAESRQGNRRLRPSHGREPQQPENAPESCRSQGKPRHRFTRGTCRPESGASPGAAGTGWPAAPSPRQSLPWVQPRAGAA